MGFIFILLFLLIGLICIRTLIKEKSPFKTHFLLYIFFALLIFVSFNRIVGAVSDFVYQYNSFIKPYNEGEYLTVEGSIDNYYSVAMDTSFTVNDIYFEYNPYYPFDLGFNNRSEYIKNGNKVRIEYVYVEETDEGTERNVIMKIEKL